MMGTSISVLRIQLTFNLRRQHGGHFTNRSECVFSYQAIEPLVRRPCSFEPQGRPKGRWESRRSIAKQLSAQLFCDASR